MLAIRKVEPVGTRKASVLVDIDLPIYPPSPRGQELRDARSLAGLTMGEAARRAGISIVEWCDIERGRRIPEDWEAAFAVLTT